MDIEYYRCQEPKKFSYELFGEEHKLTVEYHAKSVVVDGDITEYIKE